MKVDLNKKEVEMILWCMGNFADDVWSERVGGVIPKRSKRFYHLIEKLKRQR